MKLKQFIYNIVKIRFGDITGDDDAEIVELEDGQEENKEGSK